MLQFSRKTGTLGTVPTYSFIFYYRSIPKLFPIALNN